MFYVSENPPWADRVIGQNVERIEKAFGVGALPANVKGRKYNEYGCGHYGCVYPTSLPEKVLKITSDPTEVALVKFILSRKDIEDTSGIVRYHGLLALDATYRRRPVFAVLREEAYEVGFLARSQPGIPDQRRILKGLDDFRRHAGRVKLMYQRHGHKPSFHAAVDKAYEWIHERWPNISMHFATSSKSAERAALGLVICNDIVQELAQTPDVYTVGETLGWFMCEGKLLADVHLQNIGLVKRKENYNEPILAITDPGHAIDVMPVFSYICT